MTERIHSFPAYTSVRTLILMPTYNERENLPLIIPKIVQTITAHKLNAEILIIDDNSPDGTGELAEQIAQKENGQAHHLHVLHREKKEGLGPAYLAGFSWALNQNYEAIVQMDADFSHSPDSLPDLLHTLEQADMVVGSRRVPGGKIEGWNALRRFISAGGNIYAKTILGMPIHDLTAGYTAIRTNVLKSIGLTGYATTGYGFQVELKYRAFLHGFAIREIPITFPDRTHGKSKMNAAIFGEAFLKVLQLRLKK